MSRVIFVFVFAVVFEVARFPVAAEDGDGQPSVWVAPIDCDAFVAHRPDPSVEYRAGVDAAGHPVAPADLAGHEPLTIDTEEVAIDLRIPLSEFYDAPASLQPVIGNAEIDTGSVTVHNSDEYPDEHHSTDQDPNAIARACADRL